MFSLTLLDHLRLTFNQISARQKAHARAAESKARWNRLLRGGEALLMVGVTVAAVAAAFGQGRAFIIIAAALASVTLLVLIVHLTFDFEASAHAHGASSAHLWRIRERYRSLLSDLHEGVVDVKEARARRDRLIEEVGGVLDHAEIIPVDDPSIADENVDLQAAVGVPN